MTATATPTTPTTATTSGSGSAGTVAPRSTPATGHLAPDPAAIGAAVFPARPEWLTLSAALADEVEVIADRDDLLVSIAPGAGGGAPACYYPARAVIEVDGRHLPVDPATVNPARHSDRARYPSLWGALIHECGHARHTAWQAPPGTPLGIVAAAMLLEESRMEAAHLRRRPNDRHWLRACVRDIVAPELFGQTGAGPAMTPAEAAHAAGLILTRADTGLLHAREVADLAATVTDILGAATLNALREIWRTAHTTSDHDANAMIELGRRWCDVLGANPAAPPRSSSTPPISTPPVSTPPTPHQRPGGPSSQPPAPDPTGAAASIGAAGSDSPQAGPGAVLPSPLADAIAATFERVRKAVAQEQPPQDPSDRGAAVARREAAARAVADAAARDVFTGAVGSSDGKTALAGVRTPTDNERAAARVLGRALDTAGVRERVAVKTSSPVPPGRLRMRGALAADAQRAAGAMPTAQPFTRTTRTRVPTPPLRLGVACDVSGTMSRVRQDVASAAWILATAANHTRVPTDVASVIFGSHVRALTRPGTVPSTVTEFASNDNWEDIATAIDALDGVLDLSTPGAARLLVVVSDGKFRPRPRLEGQRRIDRLRLSGCAVLWLIVHATNTPLQGATVHLLKDPADTARTIGRAAVCALRAT